MCKYSDELDVQSNWFLLGQESIVIGDNIHSNGLRVISFSTSKALYYLSRSTTINADGTFKICPYLWLQAKIFYTGWEFKKKIFFSMYWMVYFYNLFVCLLLTCFASCI